MQRILQLWILLIGIALALSAAQSTSAGRQSVRYHQRVIHGVPVHTIQVDLSDRDLKVTPAVAYNRIGRRESFFGFLLRYQPLAQITGVYFGLHNAQPVGDIVIDGQRRFDGYIGTALAITADNTARIIDIPYRGRQTWSGYEDVIQGGIRLLENGHFMVYPRSQGFHDPALFGHASRTAIGLTDNRHLVMLAVGRGVSLHELAGFMQALGARDAMTLDGGASTGMAYGGRIILWPARTISNVLMVVRRPPLRAIPVTVVNRPLPPYRKPFKLTPPSPPPTAPVGYAQLPSAKTSGMTFPATPPPQPRATETLDAWMNADSLANSQRFRYSKASIPAPLPWMWLSFPSYDRRLQRLT